MLSTEVCGGKWHESLKACCAVLPRSNGEGDSRGVRSLKGKSIWQVISSMVHLWTVPPLPQINLHKRNDTQNVWSLKTSFVLHLCLEPSSCRCKIHIFAQIHDEGTDSIFGPWQRIYIYMLGWCIFRAGFKSLEQRHMSKRCVLFRLMVKLHFCYSAQVHESGDTSWVSFHLAETKTLQQNPSCFAHALCTQCLLLSHAFLS